jgi:cystathionine beta-lyase/cystathionine gamma-synthase
MDTTFSDAHMPEQSKADLIEDFCILEYLAADQLKKLNNFLSSFERVKGTAQQETKTHLFESIAIQQKIQTQILLRLRNDVDMLNKQSPTEEMLKENIQKKYEFSDLLRTRQSLLAGLIVATNWQSPSFLHSVVPQAGIQTGKIEATINDYQRDRNVDQLAFETAFKKQYIDSPAKVAIHVYGAASGMAAFSTILGFLTMEVKPTRPIIMGKSEYFEIGDLMRKTFGNLIIEVDEFHTDEIIQAIGREKPSVILFDSLTNSPGVSSPDFSILIENIVKTCAQETYVIIDNTGMATQYQPIKSKFFPPLGPVRLIVFESLNKYYQFGMDRTTGGVIWTIGSNTGMISDFRVHMGTNMSDMQATLLPAPNRKLLDARLMRLHRNAYHLASKLQQFVHNNPTVCMEKINYPGLSTYPGYPWTKNRPFNGSFFTFSFKAKYQTITYYKKFVSQVVSEAKKSGVQIVSGTSFGLDTTRIYLTAVRAGKTEPFVRISVGTETLWELEKLKDVFMSALSRL